MEGGILTFCVRFSFFNDDIVLLFMQLILQKGKINLGQIPCIYFSRPVLHPFPPGSATESSQIFWFLVGFSLKRRLKRRRRMRSECLFSLLSEQLVLYYLGSDILCVLSFLGAGALIVLLLLVQVPVPPLWFLQA